MSIDDWDYYLPANHDWVPAMRKAHRIVTAEALKPMIAFFYPFPTLMYVNGHLARVKDETRYSAGNHDNDE